jgi:hypothetical protein
VPGSPCTRNGSGRAAYGVCTRLSNPRARSADEGVRRADRAAQALDTGRPRARGCGAVSREREDETRLRSACLRREPGRIERCLPHQMERERTSARGGKLAVRPHKLWTEMRPQHEDSRR